MATLFALGLAATACNHTAHYLTSYKNQTEIKTLPSSESFRIKLNPNVSFEEQVHEGNYGYSDKFLTSANFQLSVSGVRDVTLFDPGATSTTEEMIARMNAAGCVPALIDDALAMGIQFPDRQKTNPIVFLGSSYRASDGLQHFPVLVGWGGVRGLELYWFGDDWADLYEFAAICK
jgi:hypothetical protein